MVPFGQVELAHLLDLLADVGLLVLGGRGSGVDSAEGDGGGRTRFVVLEVQLLPVAGRGALGLAGDLGRRDQDGLRAGLSGR